MCWNQEVSLLTFGIGTLVNILAAYTFPNPTIVGLALVFELVILVQFTEALGWNSIQTQNQESSMAAANALFVLVLLQPIVLALLFLSVSEASMEAKYAAVAITLLYVAWCLYVLLSISEKLRVQEKDSHLDYYWWDSIPGKSYPYLIALFGLLLLLVRPMDVAIFAGMFLALTLLLSVAFFYNSIGSIWCWSAALGMAIISLYYYVR